MCIHNGGVCDCRCGCYFGAKEKIKIKKLRN